MTNSVENSDNNEDSGMIVNIPKLSADFQCSVCGSIFTTDLDREQHLKKESNGGLHDGSTLYDIRIARSQQELNENRIHHV
ncbi:MAG TPA: hypothetical protein VH796_17200 [Nitrososphaeraceae archaeon]|jgi:hypothetical protein